MSALSVLRDLRASYEPGGASSDLGLADYLQVLDHVREALLAEVRPVDHAMVARDLLGEAVEKGVTPAAFLLAMLGNPLDKVLEQSLDGLTREGEKRLLKALRHRDYQRRRDAMYTNAPPGEPWPEVFAREIIPQVQRHWSAARVDGVRLRIDVRATPTYVRAVPGGHGAHVSLDGPVSSAIATFYVDLVDATVDGICQVIESRLRDSLGLLFDGQVRLNFSGEGSLGVRYGSLVRTIHHGSFHPGPSTGGVHVESF